MENSTKYPRSLHAGISLGSTSDDRFMPDGYVRKFSNLDLTLLEKIDGQNNSMTKYGVFARSHTSQTIHPWDKPLIERWNLIKRDLGDLELFGENVYGIHSIGYSKLESFYYLFGIRVKDTWLSWDEVCFYANLLDFPTVPRVNLTVRLTDLWMDKVDEDRILSEWFTLNLGMTWVEYTSTEGMLGGYDIKTGNPASEGFVVRNAGEYKTNNGMLNVQPNEFDNLFKVVRPKHVTTDVHWSKTWKPAKLIDYNKYNWSQYEYMLNK